MPSQRRARRSRHASQLRLARPRKNRCVICDEVFEMPSLTVKVGRGRAHFLCAALDKVGLRELARTSGRW